MGEVRAKDRTSRPLSVAGEEVDLVKEAELDSLRGRRRTGRVLSHRRQRQEKF